MKSEITLSKLSLLRLFMSKLSPLRLFMSKLSFNFLSKIFSPKILFVFSFVLVFSFSQVNFSGAQSKGSDGKCYTLAGTNGFVDSLGFPIPKAKEVDLCAGKEVKAISTQQIEDNNSADFLKNGEYGFVVKKVPCYRNGDGTLVDALTKTNKLSANQCSTVEQGVLSSSTQATAAKVSTGNDKDETGGKNFCSDIKVSGITDVAKSIGCYVIYSIMEVFLQTFAVFVKIASYMFDTVMQKFVLQISTLFQSSPGVDKAYIYSAWSVIRDLANIAAFFGAVYTGFRYITGSDSLDFKKAVTKLILYSILVNFSFPIAKFLIDISNVISLQIYGGITNYTAGNNNLSNAILEKMGAISLLISDVGAVKTVFPGFSSFSVMFLAIVYLFCIFFVFIYAAITITVRSLILLICVILSPLMFLNFAFPRLTELHEKWRENFFGQLVFAPVLMFGLWISFVLLEAATTGLNAANSALTGGSSDPNVLADLELNKIIAMTIAIITLFLAVKMSSSVAGGAGKSISGMVGGGMKGLGLAVATGGTGLLARATVGRAGAMMANSKWVQNTGAQNGASRRMAASLASSAGNKMSSFKLAGVKSFDEKKMGNLKADRDKMNTENSGEIRKTGMRDLINQAETPEQLKLAKEEMAKISSNPNYKRNEDLFGNKAKQKAFELSQSDIKSAKDNNVTFLNQGEYKNELVNKRRLESGTVSKLRDERLKKRDDGRIENLNKAKTEADVEKAFGKIVSSSEKTFDIGKEREEKFVAKSENKIESLKNTNLSDALRGKKAFTGPAPAIGSKLSEVVVEPVQTKSRVEGAVQKSDREAVK